MEQIKFPLIHPSSDLNEIKDVDFIVLPEIPSTMGMLVHIPTTICSAPRMDVLSLLTVLEHGMNTAPVNMTT